MGLFTAVRAGARFLKQDALALAIAARDPRTPLAAKLVMLAVAAYVLSPIDLIPDFIPVIGYLDDLLIVPAAIRFALRMVPPEVMAQARLRAPDALRRGKRMALLGVLIVVVIWILLATIIVRATMSLVSAGLQ